MTKLRLRRLPGGLTEVHVKVPALEMQQVQYFLAMCEELNFSRAARRCGVSQPSLSIAISTLERELGGALFDRKTSTDLAGLGRMVRPLLEEISRNADCAREVARTLTPAS